MFITSPGCVRRLCRALEKLWRLVLQRCYGCSSVAQKPGCAHRSKHFMLFSLVPAQTEGLFLLYLFRFRNINGRENTRSFWVNGKRNSIPVLVYKPSWSLFTLVYVGLPLAGTRQLVENYSAIQLQTSTSGPGSFFLCWSIGVFVSFLVFVSSLENYLLHARLRRSTAAATESATNYSLFCSASFSPLFPSKMTAVNTAPALYFLLVTMHVRRLTRKNEEDNAVGEDKKSVEKVACIYFFRISFSYTYNVFVLFTFSV